MDSKAFISIGLRADNDDNGLVQQPMVAILPVSGISNLIPYPDNNTDHSQVLLSTTTFQYI